MGRNKIELSEEQIALAEGLAAVLTNEQIFAFFGVTKTTFYRMLNDDPDLAERIERGRIKGIAAVAQKLVKDALAGNTTAQIFFLKSKAGWRENKRIELSGPDGGAIQVNGKRTIDETKLTADQKRALLSAVIVDGEDDEDDDEADQG